MDYGIFDQNQWMFPDIVREDGRRDADFSLLKGQCRAFQVQFTGLTPGAAVTWSAEGAEGIRLQYFREIEVCVNRNTNALQNGLLTTDHWEDISQDRVRRAPYRTYDPLLPADGLCAEKETEVYCVFLTPDRETAAGVRSLRIRFCCGGDELILPVRIRVLDKQLPERTLQLTNWYSEALVAHWHGLEYGSEAHIDMLRRYLGTMRDCHQNICRVTFGDMKVTKANGEYIFDFSAMKRWAELGLECGFDTLEWEPIISRPTWRDPPFTIFDIADSCKPLECLSTPGRKYLTSFLTQFNAFLTENGWREISLVHISDEPKERCADDFRILAGIFRKYLPGIRLMDAIEIYFIEEALDIYVPKNHYYQLNRNDFEALRSDRNELWFYTCNMPGGKFLNRFLDSPLLNTRLLHWGNYRYNLTGYLHWGYFYCSETQDPFEQTSRSPGLPAGDTHIVYPGKDGPLLSLRWLQMKCGTEDYEILRALSLHDRGRADALCRRVLRSFDDYVTDTADFDAVLCELTEAYAAI